ncbi:MAG: N-acetyl sugar amidotransferase [Thermodesulfovibrionales bacterium]
MGNTNYQICSRCIMDTTDPDISFDEKGVCNHCRSYDSMAAGRIIEGEDRDGRLDHLVNTIKIQGRNKPNDCIIGLSGGVDSSYVAYLAKKYGLRPLAIHLDNGWDSELAVRNIERIVNKLDIELMTHVIDWEEFKDLQRSFFKASVVDIEVLTDHAIFSSIYRIANKRKIRYFLIGSNMTTEFIMPAGWNFRKNDSRNIRAIQKRFGTKKIDSFPSSSMLTFNYYRYFKGIRAIDLLDFVQYDKEEAMNILKKELDWQEYGGKHYESIFTRFYQGYFLPVKFNIDKRKAHYSTLICSGQLTRARALELIREDPYPKEKMAEDKAYVLKKLGFSYEEFDEILRLPVRAHAYYPSDEIIFSFTARLKRIKNFFSGGNFN